MIKQNSGLRFVGIVLMIILLVTAAGCNRPAAQAPPSGSGLENRVEQEYTNTKYGLHFSYPTEWKIVKEVEKDEVLTIQLQEKENGPVSMLVVVLPYELSNDQMISEIRKLLSRSFYQVRTIGDFEEENIGGKTFLTCYVEAGEKVECSAKAAVYSFKNNSYLFTLISLEEVYGEALKDFHAVLAGLSL